MSTHFTQSPPAGYRILKHPLTDIRWEEQKLEWRSEKAPARWAQRDEHTIVKDDSTTIYPIPGDIVLLDDNGTAIDAIHGRDAEAHYDLSPMPDHINNDGTVEIHRKPEVVLTLIVSEPTAFPCARDGWRTLEPGDLLEYSPNEADVQFRAVPQDHIISRYIKGDHAREKLNAMNKPTVEVSKISHQNPKTSDRPR